MTRRVTLVDPTMEDVRYICANMREADRREIFRTRFDENPDHVAQEIMAVPSFTWVARWGSEPVAVFGAKPMWPGVWNVYMIGTDHWPRVVSTVAKHIKRFMIPALERVAHLAVTFVSAERHDAQKWLRWLGAETDVPLHEWGREREDFILMVWRR